MFEIVLFIYLFICWPFCVPSCLMLTVLFIATYPILDELPFSSLPFSEFFHVYIYVDSLE